MNVRKGQQIKRKPRVVTPALVRETLDQFERIYEMSSEEFLRRWALGRLPDDRRDFIRWYGACQLAMTMGMLPVPEATWNALG